MDTNYKIISDMKHGEIGYVVPWCIYMVHGKHFINQRYIASPQTSSGTSSVKIKRAGNAFLVYESTLWLQPKEMDHKWDEDHLSASLVREGVPIKIVDPKFRDAPMLSKNKRQRGRDGG